MAGRNRVPIGRRRSDLVPSRRVAVASDAPPGRHSSGERGTIANLRPFARIARMPPHDSSHDPTPAMILANSLRGSTVDARLLPSLPRQCRIATPLALLPPPPRYVAPLGTAVCVRSLLFALPLSLLLFAHYCWLRATLHTFCIRLRIRRPRRITRFPAICARGMCDRTVASSSLRPPRLPLPRRSWRCALAPGPTRVDRGSRSVVTSTVHAHDTAIRSD